MNILQKAYNRVQAYFVASAPFAMLKMALAGRTNTAASQYISYQAKMLRVETINDWKMGVMLATNPDNPEKLKLRQLYDNLSRTTIWAQSLKAVSPKHNSHLFDW